MQQSSNVEPRRAWAKAKYQKRWRPIEELSGATACASCDTPVLAFDSEEIAFCAECFQRSRRANLDENWDDIGIVD